jgi:hypothetical protein
VTELAFDASGSGLLYGYGTTTYYAAGTAGGSRVYGGRRGGSVDRFVKCFEDGAGYGAPPLAVWNRVAAYVDQCRDGLPLYVRRLGTAGDPPRRIDSEVDRVDVAGRFVASGKGKRIAVLDRRDGRLLYRTGAVRGSSNVFPLGPTSFELAPDGKLIAELPASHGRCPVAWFSRAEPRPHVIGSAVCDAAVRLRGGRAAWLRRHGSRARELVVARLHGRPRPVARFRGRTVEPGFAFDRGRLAYAVHRCDGTDTVLIRARVRGPVFRDRDPVGCGLRVTGTHLTVQPGSRRADVPVSCPRGCSGNWVLPGHSYIDQPFAVRRGARTAALRLEYSTVERLRKRGRARLRVTLKAADRTGRERGIALVLHLRSGG